MKYTKDVPTQPGYYWIKYGKESIGFIESLSIGDNGYPMSFDSSFDHWEVYDSEEWLYAGPIQEPEEVV